MTRLLVLSSRWPLPSIGGEKKRTITVLKELSALAEVTFVSLADGPIPEAGPEELKALTDCREVVVFPHGKPAKIFGLAKAFFSNRPLQAGYFHSTAMNNWVRLNSSKFDLVYGFLARTAEAGLNFDGPKILDLCDLISRNYAGAAVLSRGPRSWAYRFEGMRMREFEASMSERFDRSLLVNPKEVDLCRANGMAKVEHLPLGIEEPKLSDTKVKPESGRIGFLGKMDYAPNVDAVLWFARQVLIALPPRFHFRVIGASPGRKVREMESARVHVTGFVEDIAPEVQSCEWVVAPMRFGAGVQNKVLEAWILGRPVLMPPDVARGLGCEDETVASFLASTPEEYCRKIENLRPAGEVEALLSALRSQALTCHGLNPLRAKLREILRSPAG